MNFYATVRCESTVNGNKTFPIHRFTIKKKEHKRGKKDEKDEKYQIWNIHLGQEMLTNLFLNSKGKTNFINYS